MLTLFSNHDKFNIHKTLGFFSLLHFIYRINLLIFFGDCFYYNNYELLFLHFFLHLSSFIFKLPKKRIMIKPIIWKEFRLHNMNFCYRHLLSVIMFNYLYNSLTFIQKCICKIIFVLLFCYIADLITLKVFTYFFY